MAELALNEWRAKLKPDPGAPMPNVSEMIQSKYLSKADVPVPVIATIKGVTQERFRVNKPEDKDSAWILWFAELPKGMKLNTTNIRILEAGFGSQSEMWTGKRVKVYVDMSIQMAGQTVGGLRLQCPSIPAQSLVAGAQAIPPGARFDPLTGQPLAAPAAPQARFDPMTGLPLAAPGTVTPAMASMNGPPGREPGFDDDIPF